MLPPAEVTRSPLRGCMRRSSLRSLAALPAVLAGVYALAPATAGAHRTARPESGLSPTGLLQESTGLTSESSAEPAASTSTEAPSQERRARRDARAGAGCSVNLSATPSSVAPGAPLTLTGTLGCPEGVGADEQQVTLYQKVAHTPGFSAVATTATEANGAFELSLSGPALDGTFYVRCDGARSARVKVEVAMQVSIEAPAAGTELLAGRDRASDGAIGSVEFNGTVSPAPASATVALERLERNGKVWSLLGHVQLNGEGKFSISHTFACGEKILRFVVRTHGLDRAVASAPVTYQIAPRHKAACHAPTGSASGH